MFGKRNGNNGKAPSIQLSKLSSLIAEDVVIVGDVTFASGLRVDGCVKGNIVGQPVDGSGARALLVLSDKGRIEGSIRCGDAVINGSVVGDVEVENFIELQANARITGTIRYQHLKMDVGAAVRGKLMQTGDVATPDNVVELGSEKAYAAGAERR